MNDWEYCNPENLIDELPQPFKLKNKKIQYFINLTN